MLNKNQIGVTEKADPTVNLKWIEWVKGGKPAILITKAPKMLSYLINKSDNIIVHCTITGLGGGKIEPYGVPFKESLKSYHELCNLLTPQRVVIRIDPIVYWERDKTILKSIASEAEGRVRISFVDLYPHVLNRFTSNHVELPPYTSFHMPLDVRKDTWKELGYPEVCGEPGLTPTIPCVSEIGVIKMNLQFWHKPKSKINPPELNKPKTAIDSVINLLPVVIGTMLILGAFKWLAEAQIKPFIWLKSPQGKFYKFPLWQALRIIRKQHWEVADTEPIKPPLTRWQHFKRAISS
jgi:hypothetical protein